MNPGCESKSMMPLGDFLVPSVFPFLDIICLFAHPKLAASNEGFSHRRAPYFEAFSVSA